MRGLRRILVIYQWPRRGSGTRKSAVYLLVWGLILFAKRNRTTVQNPVLCRCTSFTLRRSCHQNRGCCGSFFRKADPRRYLERVPVIPRQISLERDQIMRECPARIHRQPLTYHQVQFFAHLTVAKVVSAQTMFDLLRSFSAVLDEFGVSHGRAKKAALCAAEGLMIVRHIAACLFQC